MAKSLSVSKNTQAEAQSSEPGAHRHARGRCHHQRSGPDPPPPSPASGPRHGPEKALPPAPASSGSPTASRALGRLPGQARLPVTRARPPRPPPPAWLPLGLPRDAVQAEAADRPSRRRLRVRCCLPSLCGGGSGGFQNFPGSTGCVQASGGGGLPHGDPGTSQKCWCRLRRRRDPRINTWDSRDTSSLGPMSTELTAGTPGHGAVASVTHVVAPAPGRSHRLASAGLRPRFSSCVPSTARRLGDAGV